MRKALAVFALLVSVFWTASALAAPSPALNLAAWVSQNTDLALSQIAIAGPENVYSLEPLGPRLPTGEVLALVRTEAVAPQWRAAHQFQSWDAHMLLDCKGGRVRVLRSARYSEPNRGGRAKADDGGGAWLSPEAQMPAAMLLAAACDPAFSWPLRGNAAAASKATPGAGTPAIQVTMAGSPAAPIAPAPAQAPVQIAQASPDAQPDEHAGSLALAGAAEPPPAVDKPQAAVAPVATPPDFAPAQARQEKAASAKVEQLASIAIAKPARPPLQTADFISRPTAPEPSSEPTQALTEPPHANVLAIAAAATRTCKRLAGAGRSWWRRVEVAWMHGPLQTPGRSALRSPGPQTDKLTVGVLAMGQGVGGPPLRLMGAARHRLSGEPAGGHPRGSHSS